MQNILSDQINYYRARADEYEKEIYAKRPLAGQEFTIIKVFYDLVDLQKKLERLGFEVSVEKFGENFFLMVGKKV
jgi:hypothetical protein